jgi:hypothetical protein
MASNKRNLFVAFGLALATVIAGQFAFALYAYQNACQPYWTMKSDIVLAYYLLAVAIGGAAPCLFIGHIIRITSRRAGSDSSSLALGLTLLFTLIGLWGVGLAAGFGGPLTRQMELRGFKTWIVETADTEKIRAYFRSNKPPNRWLGESRYQMDNAPFLELGPDKVIWPSESDEGGWAAFEWEVFNGEPTHGLRISLGSNQIPPRPMKNRRMMQAAPGVYVWMSR